MLKLTAVLNIPLTMAKFLNTNDLTKRALAERKMAADALECIDAQLLCLEAELIMLHGGGDVATGLAQIDKILADMKAATTMEEHQPAKAA